MYLSKYAIALQKNIFKLRTANNLTQSDLAEIIIQRQEKQIDTDGKRAIISNWERGNKLPSLEDLQTLCDIFNVSADYLLGKTEEQEHDFSSISGLSPENVDMLCKLPKNSRELYCINKLLSSDYWKIIINEIVSYMETPHFEETYIQVSESPYEDIRLTNEELENAYLLSLIQALRMEKKRRNKIK